MATYDIPPHIEQKGTIISFHGGCFTGGNPSWDAEQNSLLASIGYKVIQVDFPKTHSKFRQWAEQNDFSDQKTPLYCLGRSSGGYLAKVYSSINTNVTKVIYICPVFNPTLRAKNKPKFAQKTRQFFDEPPISTETWDSQKELLFLAKNDDHVPKQCYSQEQLDSAVYLGPRSHTGMIKCISKDFTETIRTFLDR